MDLRRSAGWAGVALVAALVLAACGDGNTGPIPQTGVRQTTTTQPTTTTTAGR